MNDTTEIAALRERFEKWAIFIFRTVNLTKSGVYADYETQLAWEAFKEGAKTPHAEPVPSGVIEAAKRYKQGQEYYGTNLLDRQDMAGDKAIIADYAIKHMPQLKGANDGNT